MCFIVFITSFSTINSQTYNPFIEELINQTNIDSLVSFVRILSGEDSVLIGGTNVLIQHRISNQNNNLAADYLKERLSMFNNLTINDQAYNVTYGSTTYNGRNIIATQLGKTNPNDIYIICAHYDSVDDYCADDNASGTTAVLDSLTECRVLGNHFNCTLTITGSTTPNLLSESDNCFS